ncbi:uracil-DNA glycosylase [Actinobacillus delphinicola]|uniref:Uracil-DNA glycosylase n=1 Tax=Actinobacillus delphinicola TaxID=51161 RepID=A0A448TS97_9PAST|nr:uracil-DNA glycosylase [Actinobacillus delphinicola]VEJ08786.1 uracil-DNA glycosylase [Actinobacillus delphinicola]
MLTWHDVLGEEKSQPYFQNILQFLDRERAAGKIIYPPKPDIFNALKLTNFDDVRVVIIGQDPYHGAGQAHGLSFSVRKGVRLPPSLQNIYKTLQKDYPEFQIPRDGDLTYWAQQGVLLLNTVLTVEAGKAHSHAQIGWEDFTDKIISALNHKKENLVFLLWGAHAQKKGQFIDRSKHCVLTSVHPSPLSAHRGFFDCGHFKKTNDYLRQHQLPEIDWQLPIE